MTSRKTAKSILIIEDDPHVADMLSHFFEKAKYRADRYVGVKRVKGELHLLDADGSQIEFNPELYAVAIVEAHVHGRGLSSVELGQLLHETGLAVCFIHGSGDLITPNMAEACKAAGLSKKSLLDGLIHGDIDLRTYS